MPVRFDRAARGVGYTLIWVGVLLLAFVGYQLFGTNLAEARAQNRLEEDFERLLVSSQRTPPAVTTSPTTTTALGPTRSPVTAPDVARPGAELASTVTPSIPVARGEALARLAIPAIGIDKIVVEAVSTGDLKKGPGHYPETPQPGQAGNSAIAGHRTTYGAPFGDVDRLEEGDEIVVTTVQGRFVYEVDTQPFVVEPGDVSVLADKGDDRLTLTSCHPRFSASERIIVTAQLREEPAPATEQEPIPEPSDADADRPGAEAAARPEGPTGDVPVRSTEVASPGRLELSLDGESAPITPAVAWGLTSAAIWLAGFAGARWWRRWPSYVLAAAPFVVSLFFFFESFARFLPSNY